MYQKYPNFPWNLMYLSFPCFLMCLKFHVYRWNHLYRRFRLNP
jgi:hypothetical protein